MTTNIPLVSVLIPLHNCEKTVHRAVDSVLKQTYTDFEVVCVLNNCTDSTEEILRKIDVDDKRIKIFYQNELKGITPTLNRGFRHCRGKFIARQDGDDYWYPEKLKKQMQYFEDNPNVDILGTQIRMITEDGDEWVNRESGRGQPDHKLVTWDARNPETHEEIRGLLLEGDNVIAHPSVVMKSIVLDCVGGYDSLYVRAEDLHLWMKALPFFKFANLQEVLVDYTVKKSSADSWRWAQDWKMAECLKPFILVLEQGDVPGMVGGDRLQPHPPLQDEYKQILKPTE